MMEKLWARLMGITLLLLLPRGLDASSQLSADVMQTCSFLQLPATSQRVPAQIEPDYNKKSSHTSRFPEWRCLGFYFFTNCIILSMKQDVKLQFSYARMWFCGFFLLFFLYFRLNEKHLFYFGPLHLICLECTDMVIGWYIARHSVRHSAEPLLNVCFLHCVCGCTVQWRMRGRSQQQQCRCPSVCCKGLSVERH